MNNRVFGWVGFFLVLLTSLFHAPAIASPCEGFFEWDADSKPSKAAPKTMDPSQRGSGNVFLTPSTLEHGAFRYDRVTTDQFKPAIEVGLILAKKRLKALRNEKSEPTFENTIEALEAISEPFSDAYLILENYQLMKKDEVIENLAKEINPKISQFGNSIYFDSNLFKRVETLYEKREQLNLTHEQKALIENYYRSFVRNGAKLDAAKKARIDELDKKLSTLGEDFDGNVLKYTQKYEMVVTDPKEVESFPENDREVAAEVAKKKGKEGSWVFTVNQSSFTSFLTYSPNRALRETLWRAYFQRGLAEGLDNRPILLEIAKLRQERAQILGYKNHADFSLEVKMAKDYPTVEKFMERLAKVYREAAVKDIQELEALAGHEMKPWDMYFYSEKLRQEKYDYSVEQLKPYFPLEQVMKGVFYVANKLYGVTLKERPDLPTWDPLVKAYEILDEKGEYLSLYYADPYERASKKSGAWNSTLLDGGFFGGKVRRPHLANVENLPLPTEGKPTLLTPDEVTTAFHEMGHALHHALSKVKYRSFFGTAVERDFVEFPSQLLENWAFAPEVLDVYAYHWQTKERIPTALVEKLNRAENFQAGWRGLRQLMYGYNDFAWYTKDLSSVKTAEDVTAWENAALEPLRVLKWEGETFSPAFAHIFSGGYSAGYYGYKWADGIVADGFAPFQRFGLFHAPTALKLKKNIMEAGGVDPAADMYRRYRGQDPDPDALLKREGLLPK